MARRDVVALGLGVVLCAWLVPVAASAQQATASGIAGVVKDTSGAVLPGVTVEASSPALIEKVRSVVTGGDGRYNIVDLRPGTYSVTFTLPSFSTFKRDGIELTSGFTATVNADMKVGALEETVTVTGAAPLVDTENVRKQTVVSNDLLNTLPSSVKNMNSLVTLTAGFAGGATTGFDATGGYTGQVGGTFHGKGGTNISFDGMGVQHAYGSQGYNVNEDVVQETVLSTSGIGADTNADGPVINLVPKEGGNLFAGSLNGLYGDHKLQSNNLDSSLLSRGLTSVTTVNQVYDGGGTLGGPIKKDKLWFFVSIREWGNDRGAAGKYFNASQGTAFYTPDFTRPAYTHEWYESKATRVTWKVSERNKINFYVDPERDCHCPANVASGSINAPEAFFSYKLHPAGLYQVTWNAPVTNKLLFEAGLSRADGSWPEDFLPGVTTSNISIINNSTGVRYGSPATLATTQGVPRLTERFSASYVTGTHAFKAGFQLEESYLNLAIAANQNVNYVFVNNAQGVPVPNQLTEYATPYFTKDQNKDFGFYGQDQWTLKRLTLNYGLRFEYFNGSYPAETEPATQFTAARSFAAQSGVPNWKDLDPRFGAAYDLFGDGKTALKVALGRYVAKNNTAITQANNPAQTSINSVNRTWSEATPTLINGNYVPNCNLSNPAANGDCGPILNNAFGGLNATTSYAPDALSGFDHRGYNWDFTTEIQRQLRPGWSLTGGYYRNWYGNFLVTDNTLVTPANYNSYCVTAPADARLPGGGGYPICGLADITPALRSSVLSVVTQSNNFGNEQLIDDFFNVSLNARVNGNLQFGGSVDTGRTVNNDCYNVNNPGAVGSAIAVVAADTAATVPSTTTTVNGQSACRIVTPFKGQTQLKAFGSYTLPKDVLVALVFQNISGPPVVATFTATNAVAAPSLGRNLSNGSASVPLIIPGTAYEGRMSRLDLKLTKRFQLTDKVRLQGNINLYNIFNGSAILLENTTYGPLWLQPSLIEDGRMLQVQASLSF